MKTKEQQSEVTLRPARSSVWKLQGVFFEPQATFEEVDRRPNWLLPLLAMIIISIAAASLVVNTIGLENIVRGQIEANSRVQQMPPEQREQIVEQAVNSPLTSVMMYVGPILGPIIIVLVVAGLLMLASTLTGGQATFKKVFSVNSHVFFFSYVVASVLSVVVVLLSPDPAEIDIQNPVATNLGFLVARTESPALYSLLSSIDLVSFYTIYLLGLGLAVVNRKPVRSMLLTVVVLWVVWVLIKTGWTAMMG
jgi:hypothetical protein